MPRKTKSFSKRADARLRVIFNRGPVRVSKERRARLVEALDSFVKKHARANGENVLECMVEWKDRLKEMEERFRRSSKDEGRTSKRVQKVTSQMALLKPFEDAQQRLAVLFEKEKVWVEEKWKQARDNWERIALYCDESIRAIDRFRRRLSHGTVSHLDSTISSKLQEAYQRAVSNLRENDSSLRKYSSACALACDEKMDERKLVKLHGYFEKQLESIGIVTVVFSDIYEHLLKWKRALNPEREARKMLKVLRNMMQNTEFARIVAVEVEAKCRDILAV